MSPDANKPRRAAVAALGAVALATAAAARPARTPAAGPQDDAALAALFGVPDKVAVVASNGADAHAEVIVMLAQAGATVVSLDSTRGAFDRAMRFDGMAGRSVSHVACDIANSAQVREALAAIAARRGRLDILANCGGLSANHPLTDMPDDRWEAVIALSLTANMFCMREAVRHMKAAGNGGAVVNVSSLAAVHPVGRNNSAYAAARAGVTMLGRTAALDYAADGIRVNTILAGAIGGPSSPDRTPLGQVGMSDVAAAILYLASPAGKWITGQDFAMDGGFLVT